MEAAVAVAAAVAEREETKTPQRSNFHENKWDFGHMGSWLLHHNLLYYVLAFRARERKRGERSEMGNDKFLKFCFGDGI